MLWQQWTHSDLKLYISKNADIKIAIWILELIKLMHVHNTLVKKPSHSIKIQK